MIMIEIYRMSEKRLLAGSHCKFIILLSIAAGILLGIILLALKTGGHFAAGQYSYLRIFADVLLVAMFFPVIQILILNAVIRFQTNTKSQGSS